MILVISHQFERQLCHLPCSVCMRPLSKLGGGNYHQLTPSSKMPSTASAFNEQLQTRRESDWFSLSPVGRVGGMTLVGKKLIEEEGSMQGSLSQGPALLLTFEVGALAITNSLFTS